MKDDVLVSATFNPKVKTYWTISILLLLAITLFGIVLIPVAAIVIYVISDRMLKAMSAKLTSRKLVVKRGILFVVEKSIPLEKITDVALSQGPIMRLFDLHRLSFETAGQSGPGALVSLVGIENATQFREAILQQKDKMSDETRLASANEQPSASSPPSNDLADLTSSVQKIEAMLAELLATKSQSSKDDS